MISFLVLSVETDIHLIMNSSQKQIRLFTQFQKALFKLIELQQSRLVNIKEDLVAIFLCTYNEMLEFNQDNDLHKMQLQLIMQELVEHVVKKTNDELNNKQAQQDLITKYIQILKV